MNVNEKCKEIKIYINKSIKLNYYYKENNNRKQKLFTFCTKQKKKFLFEVEVEKQTKEKGFCSYFVYFLFQ